MTRLPEAVISMQIESIIEYLPEINIDSLIDKKELELIRNVINAGEFDLKSIKQKLPNNISYAKIRIALAKYGKAT